LRRNYAPHRPDSQWSTPATTSWTRAGTYFAAPSLRKLGSSPFVVVNACFPSGALQAENVRWFTGLRIVTAGGLSYPDQRLGGWDLTNPLRPPQPEVRPFWRSGGRKDVASIHKPTPEPREARVVTSSGSTPRDVTPQQRSYAADPPPRLGSSTYLLFRPRLAKTWSRFEAFPSAYVTVRQTKRQSASAPPHRKLKIL